MIASGSWHRPFFRLIQRATVRTKGAITENANRARRRKKRLTRGGVAQQRILETPSDTPRKETLQESAGAGKSSGATSAFHVRGLS